LALPFAATNQFAGGMEWRLRNALGRPVLIKGKVSIHLIPWPGLSAEEVTIEERPEFGIEPLAYVTSLRAGISIWRLLQGRLDFDSIQLAEPSVNLTHGASGWNFQPLLRHAMPVAGREAAFPSIEISGGRINLKFGETKTVLYLADTTITVDPGGESRLDLRFSGEPARTDRPARAFGLLSGRGSIYFPQGREPSIDINASLQRTAIAEIATLAQGRTSGLGGFLSTRAVIKGPLSSAAVTGQVRLEGVGRFGSFLSAAQQAGLQYRGQLDLTGQTLLLETAAGNLPFSLRLRGHGILNQAAWTTLLTLRDLPFATFLSIASETGAALPGNLPPTGTLSGALGYSAIAGLQGKLSLFRPEERDGIVVLFDGPEWKLLPSVIAVGKGSTARVEARYHATEGSTDVKLSTSSMPVELLREHWRRFAQQPLPGIFENCANGSWSGNLAYAARAGHDPVVTGSGQLEAVTCQAPGLARAIQLASANYRVQGETLRLDAIEGKVGEVGFSASLQTDSRSSRPLQLAVQLPTLTLDQVQQSLGPLLSPRQGFLDRTLGRRVAPALEQSVTATVQIASFQALFYRLENFRVRVYWDAGAAQLRDITAQMEGGQLTASASWKAPRSGFEFQWFLKQADWLGGKLDVEGRTTAGGTMSGSFHATGLRESPTQPFHELEGCFERSGATPRIQLHTLEAVTGSAQLSGEGTLTDGALALQFGNPPAVRYGGRLEGLRAEFTRR
jgi:hypothetical protein